MTLLRQWNIVLTFFLTLVCSDSCRRVETSITEIEPTSENAIPNDPASTVLESLTDEVSEPEVAFVNFFDWYQDAWFLHEDEVAAMDNMSRPLRQLAVMLQAFRLMSSGGPSGYFARFDQVFDDEVVLGLKVLDYEESCSAIIEGRNMFEASGNEGLSLEQNLDIYERLPPLEEVEERIGQWMLKKQSAN